MNDYVTRKFEAYMRASQAMKRVAPFYEGKRLRRPEHGVGGPVWTTAPGDGALAPMRWSLELGPARQEHRQMSQAMLPQSPQRHPHRLPGQMVTGKAGAPDGIDGMAGTRDHHGMDLVVPGTGLLPLPQQVPWRIMAVQELSCCRPSSKAGIC